VQTYHAKKIANRLCDIYLSVVALERAEENERNNLIARLFLQHVWNRHLLDEQMLAVRYFDMITNEYRSLSVPS
jgi:acyl-CoA dehydrogenase